MSKFINHIDLLPSNSSTSIRAVDKIGSATIEKLDKSDFNLLPQSCRKELLPHLAYMYDLDISGLSEQATRDYLSSVFDIKRHIGTVRSVQLALKSIFLDSKIIEWTENTSLEPFHFQADLYIDADSTKAYSPFSFQKAKQMIEVSKNTRSVFDGFLVNYPLVRSEIFIQCNTISSIELANKIDLKNEINLKIGGAVVWTV